VSGTGASETDTRPECRIGEHDYCDGPEDIVAGDQIALSIRCSCACHQAPARR
jgi:hypothetical protein